jgi:hypothetical protein
MDLRTQIRNAKVSILGWLLFIVNMIPVAIFQNPLPFPVEGAIEKKLRRQ